MLTTIPARPLHDLVPARTLAQELDTTPGHLANLRSRGEGPPYVKIGSRVLYPRHLVDEWVAARLVQPFASAA